MKFLVAICDGKPDRDGDILTPDSFLNPNCEVPLLWSFKNSTQEFDTCQLTLEGNKLIGEYRHAGVAANLYPALCFQVDESSENLIRKATILSVGLCVTPNTDERIPKLGLTLQ